MPTHLPTLQALGALYRESERWAELGADGSARGGEASPIRERRAERYYEVAAAHRAAHRRSRRGGARCTSAAFDLRPGIAARLRRRSIVLYRREERWADLVRSTSGRPRPPTIRSWCASTSRRRRGCGASACPTPTRRRRRSARRWPSTRPTSGRSCCWRTCSRGAEVGAARGGARAAGRAAARRGRRDRHAAPAGARARGAARAGGARAGGARARARARRRPTSRRCARSGGCTIAPGAGRGHRPATSAQLPHGQDARRAGVDSTTASGASTSASSGERDDALTAYELALIASAALLAGVSRARSHRCGATGCGRACSRCCEKQARAERTPVARRRLHHATRADLRAAPARSRRPPRRSTRRRSSWSPSYEAAVAALAQVHEARGEWKALEALLQRAARAHADGGNARVSVLMRSARCASCGCSIRARGALLSRGIEASPLGRRCCSGRAARGAARRRRRRRRCSRWRRLGRAPRISGCALGYRTLAALRDEVVGAARRAPSSRSTSTRPRLGAAIPASPTAWSARCRATRTRSDRRQGAAGRCARRARAGVRLGAGARAPPVRGGVPVRSRRDAARRGARLRARRAARCSDFLPVLRGMRRIAMANEQWPAVVGAAGARGRGRGAPDNRAGGVSDRGRDRASAARTSRARRCITTGGCSSCSRTHERAYLRATALLERVWRLRGPARPALRRARRRRAIRRRARCCCGARRSCSAIT